MLVASKPVGASWLAVMSASFLFDPIDRPMMRRARRAALKTLDRTETDGDDDDIDPVAQMEDLGDALSHALIVEGTRDWRDVCIQRVDADGVAILDEDGAPVFDALPFTPDNLAMLLTDPVIFDAIDAVYVMPFAQKERVKNGSAASPSGIGEAGTPAADIASSVAAPAAIVRDDATDVHTDRKSRKRTRPTVSGKS